MLNSLEKSQIAIMTAAFGLISGSWEVDHSSPFSSFEHTNPLELAMEKISSEFLALGFEFGEIECYKGYNPDRRTYSRRATFWLRSKDIGEKIRLDVLVTTRTLGAQPDESSTWVVKDMNFHIHPDTARILFGVVKFRRNVPRTVAEIMMKQQISTIKVSWAIEEPKP